MKKILLIFSILSVSFLSVSAQYKGTSIGVRGGLTLPKITAGGDNPMSQGYSSRLAGGAALFAEFQFSELFSFQPMLEYSQQGGKRNGMQAIPQRMLSPLFSTIAALPDPIKSSISNQLPDYLYADFDSETKFDYLMVPLLAKFGWKLGENSPFRVYVSAGPFVSFLLDAHQETNGSSQLYLDKEGKVSLGNAIQGVIASLDPATLAALAQAGIQIPTIGEQSFDREDNIKAQMNKVNCGFEGNAGISYTKGRHSFFFEGGGNYGFIKLQKDSQNGDNRIGAGTLMLGYSYKL